MLGAIIGAAGATADAPTGGPVIASHNGATFSFTGASAAGSLSGDGRAYIVAPSGATLTATAPAETTWGGYAVHGAQKNPIQVASGAMKQGYDQRVDAWQGAGSEWNAALRVTYPLAVSPGDVIVKVTSSPDTVLDSGGSRAGLPEAVSVCYVLASHPAPGVGEEAFGWSPVGWPGRPTPALRYIPVDAQVAALPEYDMTGVASTPNIAFHAALAAIEKPLFPQIIGANTGNGYQVWFPRGTGGPDGNNYGRVITDPVAGTPGLMLISDEATVSPATKKAVYKALIRAGLDWFEPFRGNAKSHGANGGHYQFHHLPVAVALHALGEDIGQIRTYMPGNIQGQPFRWTQTMIDTKLVPHTGSGNSVIPQFRKTTITAVSGLNVTLDKTVYSSSKRIEGCFLKRVSDGAQSRITSTVELAPGGTNPATHTITAQPSPAFQVGDEVYVAPDQTIVAGDYDFATETSQRTFFTNQDWSTYSTSDGSEYRNGAVWASQLMAGVALGLMDSSDWDDAIGYMERANATATPTATTDFPTVFGASSQSTLYGTTWAQDVYAAHWTSIKATRGSTTGTASDTVTATVAGLSLPLVFYDSGKARMANAASIPLTGTTTAANGVQIEARIVRKDTGAQVHPWVVIGTASGGAYFGSYHGVQRSRYRLRAEVRVVGSVVAAVQPTTDILVGNIYMLEGQSEDAHMIDNGMSNATYQPIPTFLDVEAEDSVFVMQWIQGATQTFAANGIRVINPTTVLAGQPGVTRAMANMANVLTRNAPGEKWLFIAATQSGTSMTELVDDSTGRDWYTTFGDAVTYIRQWGGEVGVLGSTHTASTSAFGDSFRIRHYVIFAGMFAGGGAYDYGDPTGYGYDADHGFWDFSGADPVRPEAIFDPAVTKMAFHGPHRFEDCSEGIDTFKTATSGVASAFVDAEVGSGMDIGSRPRRFFTQGAGLASTETVVIEGSATGTPGSWTTVHTHAGSNSAHFDARPGGTIYRYYRSTVTKTGGGAVSANVYITGISGLIQQKQDTRGSIRNMVADPVLAPIMLPKGPEIIAYMNGFPGGIADGDTFDPNPANWRDWNDWAHPCRYNDDGLTARARHTAIAMLYAFGAGPAVAQSRHVPKFNKAYWHPTGAFVELWYEYGTGSKPPISTTRRERGEAAIPTTAPAIGTMPHRTEVAGFYIDGAPAQRVEIATSASTPASSTGTAVVRVYPNPAGSFAGTEVIEFLPGGASGNVVWPEDPFAEWWKNIPIAVMPGFDYSITNFDGIAMEPMPAQADIAHP